MHQKFISAIAAVAATACLSQNASAHDGRRFEIQIHDGQLFAQGYLSGANPEDDGGGIVRPYVNSMHSHWGNHVVPAIDYASGTLPGFDIFGSTALDGFELTLTLNAASKWVNPPLMPAPGTVPDLVPLEAGETVTISRGNPRTNTDNPGTFVLEAAVGIGGTADMDPLYEIEQRPEGEIFVFEWILATNAPGIEASEPIYVLMSPDGDNPMDRLHHASLYLEQYFGTQVPAPGGVALLAIGSIFGSLRRRSPVTGPVH